MLKDNNIVEKSKALVWAKFKDYSLGQLKVLDTYLSRINARDTDSDFVSFTKQEYAELIGLKDDIKASQLKPHLRKLLANVVEFKLPGGVTINYSNFSDQASEEMDKIEERLKSNYSADYFFMSGTN